MTNKKRSVTRFVRVVYSTEEMADLQRRVKEAGGRIIGTGTAAGAGISVTIEIDSDKRQF